MNTTRLQTIIPIRTQEHLKFRRRYTGGLPATVTIPRNHLRVHYPSHGYNQRGNWAIAVSPTWRP